MERKNMTKWMRIIWLKSWVSHINITVQMFQMKIIGSTMSTTIYNMTMMIQKTPKKQGQKTKIKTTIKIQKKKKKKKKLSKRQPVQPYDDPTG